MLSRIRQLTYIQLLSRPTILLLWLGQVTSTMGDRLYDMAVIWLVMQWTDSPQTMAAVSLAGKLPAAVLGLFAGAMLDRIDRMKALLRIDWARAAILLLLPVLYYVGALNPITLAITAALMGILSIFFDPGLQAAVSSMVEPEHLGAINGLLDTTSRLGRSIGPALASFLLLTVPMVHFFTVDALTFVISAITLLLIIRRMGASIPAQTGPRGSVLQDAAEGVRIAYRNPFLRWGLIVRTLCNLFWPAFDLGIPLLAAKVFGGDSGLYGLMLGSYTFSTLTANVIFGNMRLPSSLVLFCGAWAWSGISLALIGFSPSPALAVGAAALMGISSPIIHIVLDGYVARALAPNELGRYFGLTKVCLIGAGSLGLPAMGLLMGSVGPRTGMAISGGAMVAIAVLGGVGTVLGRRALRAAPHMAD